MAKKIFYVSRTEDPGTGTAGAATLNRADQPQLMKVYDTVADAEADIANIDTNEIVGTKEVDLSSYTIVNRVAEGNLNPVTSNAVANALSYSTTETLTGGKWIDGKPIYRKVLTYSYGSSGGTSPVNIDISNSYIDSVVSMNGVALVSGTGISKSYAPIIAFMTSSSETVNGCQMYISEDKATFTFKAQGSGLSVKVYECTAIIEYTKTTD